jgi:cell division protein ZapA
LLDVLRCSSGQLDGGRGFVSDQGQVVSVEINGGRYPIRTELDPEYVLRLASYVDEKIRAAAGAAPSSDAVKLAVLAALNIADEYFRCADLNRARTGELAERAQEIEQLLDRVLMA